MPKTHSAARRLPPEHDLRQLLRFSLEEGSIWLGSRRMVLMHAESLGWLRQSLLNALGTTVTRRLLLHTGFASGLRDAEFALQLRRGQSLDDIFLVGPQLHMIEGAAKVVPLRQEMDPARGTFTGEFLWQQSWEAYAHMQMLGHSSEPVCWSLLGYASGYTSGFMGCLVLFEEIECAASGHAHCRILGKSLAHWPEDAGVHQLYDVPELQQLLQQGRDDGHAPLYGHARQDAAGAKTGSVQAGHPPATTTPGQHRLLDARQRMMLQRAMLASTPILISGEYGTGKERLARQLHAASSRADEPFLVLDCDGLQPLQLQAQLFGIPHTAVGDTAMTSDRWLHQAGLQGLLHQAGNGTLLIRNVEGLPPSLQSRLQEALVEKGYHTQTEAGWQELGVQVVTTTTQDLQALSRQGLFRRDLLRLLEVASVHLPPLRESPAQIPAIAQSLIQKFARKYRIAAPALSEHAMLTLQQQPWPENVTELAGLLERALLLAGHDAIIDTPQLYPLRPEQLHTAVNRDGSLSPRALRKIPADVCQNLLASGVALPDLESQLLEFAVQQARGNLSAAARQLGITRPQLAYRLQRISTSPAPKNIAS